MQFKNASLILTLRVCQRLCLGVMLLSMASPAVAGLDWQMRIENPPAIVSTTETVVLKAVLMNSPASTENLGVISGGVLGNPPGFDYEIGAFASVCSGWSYGIGNDLQSQFHGVDLAPGEIFEFTLGSCTPPAGGYTPGIVDVDVSLQLFESSVARPQVGSSDDRVRWIVSDDVSVALEIEIDIQPGGEPNSINLDSNQTIPVAILSTPEFDALQIDPLSARFGPSGAVEVHQRGHAQDVDGDGDVDLLLHFAVADTGLACGDTAATLTAETYAGLAVEGNDSINVIGCSN